MQAFIAESRSGATRRRNILTGSLAAGLFRAGVGRLAYWQRGIAVQERQIADAATPARRRHARGCDQDRQLSRLRHGAALPRYDRNSRNRRQRHLDRARGLQEQLTKSINHADLKYSEASALSEMAGSLQAIGDSAGALSAAEEARQIMTTLVAASPNNNDCSAICDHPDRVESADRAKSPCGRARLISLQPCHQQNLSKSDPTTPPATRYRHFREQSRTLRCTKRSQSRAHIVPNSLVIRQRLAGTDPGNIRRKPICRWLTTRWPVQLAQSNLRMRSRHFAPRLRSGRAKPKPCPTRPGQAISRSPTSGSTCSSSSNLQTRSLLPHAYNPRHFQPLHNTRLRTLRCPRSRRAAARPARCCSASLPVVGFLVESSFGCLLSC